MNWDKIKEKYPKAFDKYINWCHAEDCPSIDCYEHTDRDSYDFFDEQVIYITVAFNNEFGQGESIQYWMGEIDIKLKEDEYEGDYFERSKTRIEAEEKAFEQAFSILESKVA